MRQAASRLSMALCASALSNRPRVCICRKTEGRLLIEIVLGGSLRELSRPTDEPVERGLFRLAKAAAGKQPKGRRAETAPTSATLRDASEPIPPSTPALEAWARASTLEVSQSTYAVLFEPPEVRAVDLGVAPLVGVPLTPCVTTANCATSDLTATWQLAPADNNNNNNDDDDDDDDAPREWVTVGHGLTFTPSPAHLGGSLRVHVAPPQVPLIIQRCPSLIASVTDLITALSHY